MLEPLSTLEQGEAGGARWGHGAAGMPECRQWYQGDAPCQCMQQHGDLAARVMPAPSLDLYSPAPFIVGKWIFLSVADLPSSERPFLRLWQQVSACPAWGAFHCRVL